MFSTLTFPSASFRVAPGSGASGVADPTSVTAIQIVIDDAGSGVLDAAVDFIQTKQVPEPSIFILLGVGMVSMAFLGWRRENRDMK